MDTEAELLSLEEAAHSLGLLRITLREAVARGYLLPERVRNGTLYFRRETLQRYATALGLPSTAATPTRSLHR